MVDTTNVAGAAKSLIPQMSLMSMVYIVIIILVIGVFGIIAWILLRKSKFNKIVRVFEKVNGVWEPVRTEKAMLVKLGKSGDNVLFTKTSRKYLPMPKIQTGRNVYWYAVREDDEWINFGVGDINTQMREAGARFLDKEMRYARTGIQKSMIDRYDKPKFWEKYGGLIVNIAVIVIIMVFLFLIVGKMIELSKSTNAGVETANKVLDKADQILGKVAVINQGGSGYTTATT